MMSDLQPFQGFAPPEENWSKLPHAFIESMPLVETVGEMKVILYILRHTWGFQDQSKRITLDEFENGRKTKSGRMDSGTGLSRPTIIDGLERAEAHGFITVEVDERDKARVKKSYSLAMLKDFTPGVKKLDSSSKDSLPRSEKETVEKKPTQESNGRDFLGDVLDLDEELFGDNADRPKGWRAMDEAEYKVCTRVAEHWRKGILPMQAKFIEIQQVAAAELLSMFDGDVRKTIQMIDAYRQEYVEKKRDFTVSGPQGLLNEMPAFLARRGRQGDPIQPAFEIIVVPVEDSENDNGNKGNGEAVGNVKPQDTGNGTRRPRGTFSTIRRTGP